ncbi:uncharacterized protein TRIVIDRAFT_36093 [Trichoderma virens Gv29-8]|uniref:Uncharacterized protein n=1 Tax=Hypocrea virens (strain Gv29-8 / FGSC 10586) TaxID=413071 RepID=G9MHS9_HYPVG|nr:uncharacterized protein TRIVIDRAFT_36093 [Trichoderma virens Gv29-8]EHK26266.1 hypothetical protein TRIVIDRAFT_36093 [Trichoderma virens Gv29-8]
MTADDFDADQRSQHTDESIINRKRELKGLSSSFSSNIGQRIPPSHLSSTSNPLKSDGRSVKSIVAWLESASTNADTSRYSGDDIKSVHSVGTISSAGSNSSLLSRHTIPGASDVEEYSLTLLKYKKYYTEVPLGRCLDGHEQDEAEISCDTQVGNTPTEVSLLQESDEFSSGMCSAPDQQLSVHLEPGYGGDSARIGDKEPNSINKEDCHVEEIHLFHRDPEEVIAF